MDIVHLVIEDEKVNELRIKGSIEPTFEIRNQGNVYPCNPIPAVESAHLTFEGYEATKNVGYLEVQSKDPKHLIPSIIGFLHGKALIIEPAFAANMAELASELGIPLVEEYARNCAAANLIYRFDKEFEANYAPEIL